MIRFLPLFTILLLTACSAERRSTIPFGSNPDIRNIIVTKPEPFDFESVFSEMGVIRLDTSSKAYMTIAMQMRVYKGRIYILDGGAPESVLVFDMSGKFIRKIGVIGRGPKELLTIKSMEIDYVRDRLYLSDNYGSKCVAYDLDGNYLFTVPLGYPAGLIAVTGEGNIVHDSQRSMFGLDLETMKQHENIMILDTLGNVLNKGFDYDYNRRINAWFRALSVNKANTVTFLPIFRDTIYSVSETEIKPLYAFDMSRAKELTKKQADKYNSSADLEADVNSGYVFLEGKHLDTPNVLYAQMGLVYDKSHLFYDKTNGTTVIFKQCPNDDYRSLTSIFFPMRVEDYDDGYFYGIMSEAQFLIFRKSGMAAVDGPAKSLLDELTEEETMVIVYFKHKSDVL